MDLGLEGQAVLLAGASRGIGLAAARPFALEGSRSAVVSANLRAAVTMTRLVLPSMKERRSGAVIHVTSIFGREWGGAASYMAAKAGLIAYSKACARELAPHGIRVNSVAPGSTLFPGGSWDRRRKADPGGIAAFVARELPLGRFGHPVEVAAGIVFLASQPASLVIGARLNVDGGQRRSLI